MPPLSGLKLGEIPFQKLSPSGVPAEGRKLGRGLSFQG